MHTYIDAYILTYVCITQLVTINNKIATLYKKFLLL